MKVKTKVLITITMLFLVSTIAGATSVNAVKAGEVIKVHLSAEGSDLWDPGAYVLITANVEHDYLSSWTEKADFKKIGIDPITNEEVMLYHGKIKDGVASQAMGVLTGGAFLIAFAIKLGASNFVIGLLAAIGPLSQLLQ